MQLLSYVGQVGKRRARFEERALDLSKEFPGVDALEKEMLERSRALTYRLEYDKIRFGEFQRAVADDTVTSALAGIFLGGGEESMKKDTSFAEATRTLPWLWRFYNDIETAILEGRISQEEASEKREIVGSPTRYAPKAINAQDGLTQTIIDQMPTRNMEDTIGKAIPATWEGVAERTSRYLSTPVWGFYSFGEMDKNRRIGYKEARRVANLDKRCCDDCRAYNAQGWQPIGLLPPPGQRCQCLDRCRCFLEFR